MRRLVAIAVAVIAAFAASPASAKAPMEAFGDIPEVRGMELSPDGTHIAYLLWRNGVEQLMLIDLNTRKQEPLATVTDFKARGVSWVGNNYVILHASVTTQNNFYFTDRYEHTGAFAVNLTTRKPVRLLRRADSLFPAQSGLGLIEGVDPSGKYVFMPAYIGELSTPSYNLLRVNLDTGDGAAGGGRSGASTTKDWVLNGRGEVVAREDYDEKSRKYSIRAYSGDSSREIYSKVVDRRTLNLIGLSLDETSLIVSDRADSDFYSLYEMSLADGSL